MHAGAAPPIGGEWWALASGMLWAVGVVLFARAGEAIAPLPLNLFKNAVSLAFLVPLTLIAHQTLVPDWDARTWGLVVLSGVVGIGLADSLFFLALNQLGAGLNAIVDCLYYPSMVAVAVLLLRQPVSRGDAIGGLLVVGAVLLASLAHPVGGRRLSAVLSGVAIGAVGMVLVAVSVALVDGALGAQTVLAVTVWRLMSASLTLLPVNLALPASRAMLARLSRPSALWRHAVPASIVGGALAMWAWLAGFSAAEVSRAAVLNQLSTIWIMALAIILLGEKVTARRILALALAFGGALLVMLG